jgi:hypothetical protein
MGPSPAPALSDWDNGDIGQRRRAADRLTNYYRYSATRRDWLFDTADFLLDDLDARRPSLARLSSAALKKGRATAARPKDSFSWTSALVGSGMVPPADRKPSLFRRGEAVGRPAGALRSHARRVPWNRHANPGRDVDSRRPAACR